MAIKKFQKLAHVWLETQEVKVGPNLASDVLGNDNIKRKFGVGVPCLIITIDDSRLLLPPLPLAASHQLFYFTRLETALFNITTVRITCPPFPPTSNQNSTFFTTPTKPNHCIVCPVFFPPSNFPRLLALLYKERKSKEITLPMPSTCVLSPFPTRGLSHLFLVCYVAKQEFPTRLPFSSYPPFP